MVADDGGEEIVENTIPTSCMAKREGYTRSTFGGSDADEARCKRIA